MRARHESFVPPPLGGRFTSFLGEQLGRKQNQFTIPDSNDGGASADTNRDALLSGVIQRHGLQPGDSDILSGISDEDLDEAAERLAALLKEDSTAHPATPRPTSQTGSTDGSVNRQRIEQPSSPRCLSATT